LTVFNRNSTDREALIARVTTGYCCPRLVAGL
jgi:hypothetical protein